MAVSDPVADFMNRIKNGQKARFERVDVPASRMKVNLARILKDEGYIKNFKLIKDNKQGILRVQLKYTDAREGAIVGIKRVSRPGCRVYVGHEDIPRVMNGLGLNILSTSKGILTDRDARREGVGGELLCSIW
ncbi:MAG: 30S ribosomal protein S8 [Deltaproteobacteria bacterium]|jgi:small subunit ribosomal protein S8|nr:30S ribosomal protein S8 [Deltaproteobacteria bacterium]